MPHLRYQTHLDIFNEFFSVDKFIYTSEVTKILFDIGF